MKTKIRDILSISIFLVLIFASALVMRPAYLSLLSRVSEYTQDLISEAEEFTSLKISYKSLSPSILSAFYVKDITMTDEGGEVVAKIDKVRLEYRLWNLIRGNIDEGFKSLTSDGVEVNVDAAIPVVQRFIKGDEKRKGFDYSSFKARLPIDLVIKNISLVYRRNNLSLEANIKKITAEYSKRKNELDVSLNSFVKASLNKNSFSGNINLTGNLFDAFENSTAKLTLSNLSDGSVKFNKLNLILNFKEQIFTLATIQNTFPLRFSAIFDTQQKYADVTFVANDFSVDTIFASGGRRASIKKYNDFKLTSDTNVTYVIDEKSLSYRTNTKLTLPESILYGGAVATLNARGDEKEIDVKEFSLQGENYDISSNFDFIFEKLHLSGLVEAPKVVLPNGTTISTEVYIDPLKEGFMAFIPQVFIDEKAFTALQLSVLPNDDSVDFSFEGYDYTHFETGEPGKIMIDGSYLISSKYIQTSLSMNSFYLDSVIDTAVTFINPEMKTLAGTVSKAVENFMFSGDAYFSTDFSSVSFNVPYVLLANTKHDNQFMLFSFDGNEQSISISQGDIIFGKQAFHATGNVDKMIDSNDFFFTADLSTDAIPYHFAGTWTEGLFRISGDYDAEFEIGYDKDSTASGYCQFANLPFPVFDTSIIATLNSTFYYSIEAGPEINLMKFELEEVGNKFTSQPHIAVSGNATKYGAQFDSITYSDLYSTLDGTSDIILNLNDGLFSSASVFLNMNNPMSDERVSVEANISNPDELPFSLNSLLKNFYFNSSININRLSLNRFTRVKSANNELTAEISFTGTIEHPYLSVAVDNASVMISGNAINGSASILLEDRELSFNDVNIKYRELDVNNVSGSVSLDTFNGEIGANIDCKVMEENIHVPITLSISDSVKDESKFLPSAFTLTVASENISGTFMKKNVAFSLSALYSPDVISIISSDNIGLYGYYNRTGEFSLQLNTNKIAKLNLSGVIEPETLNMIGKVSDIAVNLKTLCSYFYFHNIIEVYSGDLRGSLSFKGSLTAPEFVGAMSIDNPDIKLPMYLPGHITTDKLLMTFYNSEISFAEKTLKSKKGEALGSCKIFFDKWKLEHLEASLKTVDKKPIPVNVKTSGFSVKGNALANLEFYYASHDLDITGNIFADEAEMTLNLAKLLSSSENQPDPGIFVNVNFDCSFGNHVRMNIEPLLRCVFVPNGKLAVQYNQRSQQLVLGGQLGLKSGDVSYLNRNFYIKDGMIKFSEKDSQINPRITVRAEIKEKDSKGDNVTIVLSADNQEFSSFEPRFSSIPAKSDNEIRTILGQIAIGDSESMSKFIFSAGDYALQSMLGRKLENSLRDLLNLDILSMRTNILQNALSSTGDVNNHGIKNFNAGNLLDNSTVYIGKYLGSLFYVDAMVHLQYDDRKVESNAEWINGIEIKPEFGFEFESPFEKAFGNDNVLWNFNFRLNIAPDINAMIQNQQFVPDTSFSLSWKFSF